MTPLSTEELIQLKVIMHKMLRFADESNWQELNRADIERLAILKHGVNGALESDSPDYDNRSGNDLSKGIQKSQNRDTETEALIDELTRLDALIIESVQTSKSNLIKQNRELSEQVKAKEVYAQASQFR